MAITQTTERFHVPPFSFPRCTMPPESSQAAWCVLREEVSMARDPAERREVLATQVTIVQLQMDLLHRQIQRRAGLSESDRQWLMAALETIGQATQAMIPLVIEDDDVEPTRRQTAGERAVHRS
jgi:hypothetical protein